MSRMRIPGRGGGGVSALAINVAPTEGTVMAGARSWSLIRDQSLIRGRGRGGACSFLFCMKIDSFRSGEDIARTTPVWVGVRPAARLIYSEGQKLTACLVVSLNLENKKIRR
jgi:hypothetical protein